MDDGTRVPLMGGSLHIFSISICSNVYKKTGVRTMYDNHKNKYVMSDVIGANWKENNDMYKCDSCNENYFSLGIMFMPHGFQ